MYKFLCALMFSFLFFVLGVTPGAELRAHAVTLFNYLRNCHTVFQSGYITLHPPLQQRMRVPISPHLAGPIRTSFYMKQFNKGEFH